MLHKKNIPFCIYILLALAIGIPIQATDLIVNPDAGPFYTIQEAYDATISGSDTILLSTNYIYSGTGNINLIFDKDFTLGATGTGTNPIIDMQNAGRFCFIGENRNVIINNLEIKNGNLSGQDYPDDCGGAILNYGNLVVFSCTFSSNTVEFIAGAIENYTGTLNISNCIFIGNSTKYAAGVIWNEASTDLSGCTFNGNNSPEAGVIYNNKTLNIT